MKHKSTASVPHATLQSTVRLGARGTQLDPDGLAPGDAPFTFYKNLLCVEHVVATAKGQARPHNHGRRVPVHGEHELTTAGCWTQGKSVTLFLGGGAPSPVTWFLSL